MTKHTGIVASEALKRRIPPARPMPSIPRARTPGWISAKTVGSFVPGLTRKVFEKFGFSTAALITDWDRIVGSRFASYTAPHRLKWPKLTGSSADPGEREAGGRPGATLMLKVDPARALDAEYGACQIIDRINAYFGYRAVAEIRLIQAPLSDADASRPAAFPARAPARPAAAPVSSVDGNDALAAALTRLGAGIASRTRHA